MKRPDELEQLRRQLADAVELLEDAYAELEGIVTSYWPVGRDAADLSLARAILPRLKKGIAAAKAIDRSGSRGL
jgi:hypothetical protein